MRPEARFLRKPKSFWACVRTLSQEIGYTERGTGQIKVPTAEQMAAAFAALHLAPELLQAADGTATDLAPLLSQSIGIVSALRQSGTSTISPRLTMSSHIDCLSVNE